MQFNNNRTYILLGIAAVVIIAGIVVLISAFGSSSGGRATPTLSVDAIYTSAYQTVSAAQTAQQASLPPTSTPEPSPFPTLPAASPLPVNTLVIASPTTGVAQGCDSSTYISDVTIQDGTTMTPGQSFTKTWAVQNSGTCAWNTNYKLMFVFGTSMNGTSAPISQTVPPGGQTQISVNLVAPTTPGNYTGNWKMQNDKGQYFGTYLTVVINVVAPTGTSTSAVTPTDTSTPTATNTPVTPAADAAP